MTLGIWYSWIPIQCKSTEVEGLDSLVPIASSIQAEFATTNNAYSAISDDGGHGSED